MEQHGLKQKELMDVFGTPSMVSEVLNGKREMNKEHIKRLRERFPVSPEIFFWTKKGRPGDRAPFSIAD